MNRDALKLFPILHIQKLHKDQNNSHKKSQKQIHNFDMKILKEIEKRLYRPQESKSQNLQKETALPDISNISNIQFENSLLIALNNKKNADNDSSPIKEVNKMKVDGSIDLRDNDRALKCISLFKDNKRHVFRKYNNYKHNTALSASMMNQRQVNPINLSLSQEENIDKKEEINNRCTCLPSLNPYAFHKRLLVNDSECQKESDDQSYRKRGQVRDSFMLQCRKMAKTQKEINIPITKNVSINENTKRNIKKSQIKLMKMPHISVENYLLGDCEYKITSKERQQKKQFN